MADVNGTDQEMPLYLFILKLLKNESDEFEKLQELCKKISKVLPDLEIPNKSNSTFKAYKIDERAKQQLDEKRRQDLADYSPVETEGDGSCLFRALSFLCFGHQNRHRELRVRCVIEMATNSKNYYNNEELLKKTRIENNSLSNRKSESMKKSNAVQNRKSENGSAHDASESEKSEDSSENGSTEDDASESEKSEDSSENGSTEETDENIQPSGNDVIKEDFKNNVCETCDPTAYTGFWEIQALGVILKRKIKVVCSSSDETELEQLERAYGVDLESDEPPLTIMFLLDDKHFVPLIPKEVKEEEDSGRGDSLNDSKAENTTPLETKVKKEKDSGLGDSLLNESTEKDTPPLDESTTKKAKDKASNDAKVKNESNKSIEGNDQEPFKPSHTSTPKKAPKDKAPVQESDDDGRVDITSGDNHNLHEVLDKLNNLCGVECNIKARLRKKRLSIETLKSLTGPYEMADPEILGILKTDTVMFVSKLIEVQFQIKWNTEDGMPQKFNFYDFCNVEKQTAAKYNRKKTPGKTVHLAYYPRRAHVFTELYRTAVDMSEAEFKQAFCPDQPKEAFCPDVYVRVEEGWARLHFASQTCVQVDLEELSHWMHKSLLKFVSEAEKLEITLTPNPEDNFSRVTEAIKEPTLYWAVLQDIDFRSGDHLKLHKIGKTQVYVGKANGGIRSRWIQDSSSHSKQMMKCMNCVICKQCMKCSNCKKFSFDAARLWGIQLVDARLLLAKIRNENRAVFLIRTFEETKDLEKGEKQHIEGKRIVSGNQDVNIVLYEDINDTWTPKEMQYGMNGRS